MGEADRVVVTQVEDGLTLFSVLRPPNERVGGAQHTTYELWRGTEWIAACASMQDVFDQLRMPDETTEDRAIADGSTA